MIKCWEINHISLVTDKLSVYRKKTDIYSADMIPILSISVICHDILDTSTHL